MDTGAVPVAAVGYFHFSGSSATGQYSGVHGGTNVVKTFVSGTVTVARNGIGHMDVTDNTGVVESLDFVVGGQGTVMYLVHTRNGTTCTYEARKV
ncbi:MAG TPA: hypothetical protein VF746_11895 [Longimicrobium sp.]|jgi:hypothetical protein